MSSQFFIKRGDRNPPLRRTLEDADGNAVDLTGTTVKFYMKNSRSSEIVVNGTTVVPLNAVGGVVQYEWEAGSTDTAGEFIAEFEVTDSGLKETFPNDDYIHIQIKQDIR